MKSSTSTPVLLASGNPAKQDMLRWLLEGLPMTPVLPQELGLTGAPDEEGDTHLEVARQKARQWSQEADMLAVATDGGLVIPALGHRWQSLFTHRFAGPAADDAERCRRLLKLMRPYQGTDRAASWVEALAVADRGELLASWELQGGIGLIADIPAAGGEVPGFWVFSMWYFPQYGKVYNRLSPQEKEALDDHWVRLRELAQGFFRSGSVAQTPIP